jgi:O-antigen/teichoic acid export membrane protein
VSQIKKLAGQTLWYGMSSVGVRMLSYLLNPLLVYLMNDASGVAEYGGYSLLFACIAFANIIFTYGFETGFFRFSNKEGIDKNSLYQTTFGSLLISSVLMAVIIGFFYKEINTFLQFEDHPEYILWALGIIVLDTLSVIPFAKLRQNNQPRKYAFIKIGGVLINICLVVFLVAYLPLYYESNSDALGKNWYMQQNKIGLILIANLFMSLFIVLMLYKEWKSFRFKINIALWKQVFQYSSPMIIIGLAGMVNEVLDRVMLAKLLPLSNDTSKAVVGVYAANYKLAIFITLFIQAFKMAAEPFFFKQSNDKNSPQLYAKVMKWFVVTLCIAFLFTMLFIDVWQYLIADSYRVGLGVVPILLMANIFLGIYYNLSVWYKITDNMRFGIYITVFGATITLVGNYIFIPYYGMYATAWVTFACYLVMVVVSYVIGQKYFPIPYPLKDIAKIIALMLVVMGLHQLINKLFDDSIDGLLAFFVSTGGGLILMIAFVAIIMHWFKNELGGLRRSKNN